MVKLKIRGALGPSPLSATYGQNYKAKICKLDGNPLNIAMTLSMKLGICITKICQLFI